MKPSTKSAPKPSPNFRFEAIGTSWFIELYHVLSEAEHRELLQVILKRIDEFDKNYSRFRGDSLVTRMAKKAGTYALPTDAHLMLNMYRNLYESTDGLVTPLIGQVLSDAGYDAEYSLKSKKMSSPPSWDEVLKVGPSHLTLKQPALLDFGAAGKGYLVDIIGELLETRGFSSFCIDAGGDILYRHPTARLDVGLEHPGDPSLAIGVAHLQNQALCGSAGNRRAWGEYHHIFNPKKLISVREIQAVWVVAESALLADGLATALFFAPAERLHKQYTFEYALVRADETLEHSTQFPAEFFNE